MEDGGLPAHPFTYDDYLKRGPYWPAGYIRDVNAVPVHAPPRNGFVDMVRAMVVTAGSDALARARVRFFYENYELFPDAFQTVEDAMKCVKGVKL
jgi:hypothetical protein